MSRPKHTNKNAIDPLAPIHEQSAIAHMGNLRDYEEIFEAVEGIVYAFETKDFHFGCSGESSMDASARQVILKFVVSAILEGKPEKIRALADVLEQYLKGSAVRPLEAFLLQLKISHQEWEGRKKQGETEGDEDIFWEGWPFGLSRLKELFMKSRGKAYNENGRPVSDVKKAAELVGLAYRKIKKGRPRGSKNRGQIK